MEDEYRLDAHNLYEMLYFWNACDEAGRQDLLYFDGDIGDRDNYLEWAYDLLFQVFHDVDGMFYGEDENVSTFSIASPAMQAYLHHAYWHGHKHGLRHEGKGSRAHPYLHVTGDTGAQTAILMEGAMKADIMNYFTVGKRLFIAQAGAGNQKHVIPLLQRLGVSRVSIGYDMDRLTNPHIQRHVESLVAKLNTAQIAYRLAQWDSSFNGMDDYALHVLKQKAA